MSATRGLIMLFLTGAVMLTWPARAKQDGELFQDRVITIGTTEYHFRVFTPKGWSKKKQSPVILFLHGAGERGDDNLAQTKIGIGPAIVRHAETLPFIVVMPQCARGRWWTEPDMQAQALKALEQTVKEFNGDPKRTYLTGLSMGGYGCGSWPQGTTHCSPPLRLSAAVFALLQGSTFLNQPTECWQRPILTLRLPPR